MFIDDDDHQSTDVGQLNHSNLDEETSSSLQVDKHAYYPIEVPVTPLINIPVSERVTAPTEVPVTSLLNTPMSVSETSSTAQEGGMITRSRSVSPLPSVITSISALRRSIRNDTEVINYNNEKWQESANKTTTKIWHMYDENELEKDVEEFMINLTIPKNNNNDQDQQNQQNQPNNNQENQPVNPLTQEQVQEFISAPIMYKLIPFWSIHMLFLHILPNLTCIYCVSSCIDVDMCSHMRHY
jgi:hypothetical protein